MDGPNQNIETMASAILNMALHSGNTWEEIIVALGITARVLALMASTQDNGKPEKCLALACEFLAAGMKQEVDLISHKVQ